MKFTLWDHCFELPHKHLEAEKQISDSVQVGQVTHKLKVGSPDRLEIYDWPARYAQRFDGVGPGGEDRPSDIQKIFQDNQRHRPDPHAARGRRQSDRSVASAGSASSPPGTSFTLKKHFNANGAYVLTTVITPPG